MLRAAGLSWGLLLWTRNDKPVLSELGILWPHNVVFVLTVSYVGPVTASMAMFSREGVLSSGTPLHKCPDQSSSVQLPVHVIEPYSLLSAHGRVVCICMVVL